MSNAELLTLAAVDEGILNVTEVNVNVKPFVSLEFIGIHEYEKS